MPQAPFRKIVVCLDGTGNEVGDRETNVLKLYKTLTQDETQRAHYTLGVGTYDDQQLLGRPWQRIKGFLGMAFGLGLEDDVLEGYRYLCRTYRSARSKRADHPDAPPDRFEDDMIYIVGFSRGAYAARALAGFIHNFGLIEPDKLHLIAQVFRAYRRVTDFDTDADPDVVFQALREYERVLRPDRSIPIRALCLFDTVSSIVRFRRIWHNFTTHGSLAELGTHASVDRNASVRIVCHALAIDERRSMYRAQLWNTRDPVYYGNRFKRATPRRQYVVQRWFPGYHSDIGGSPPEDEAGIGKITVLWMLDRLAEAERQADAEDNAARADAGKPPLPGTEQERVGLRLMRGQRKWYLEGDSDKTTPGGLRFSKPDPLAPIHPSVIDGWMPRLSWIWLLLEIFPKSIKRREPNPPWYRRGLVYYLPLLEPRTIPDSHEVDDSAFVRRADPKADYDPPNLRPGP
jgi:uncharacterized protein (DUF2235 family)